MKRRLKIPLLAVVILAAALPAGFAIAQVVEGESEGDRPPITHNDPDPSTDAVEIGKAYKEAQASGDHEAIERAADAVRDEWFSRLGSEERAGAETAPPEADPPAGTYAYINESITDGQVAQCKIRLAQGHEDELCELIVLYGEGEIEAGPYTKAEVEIALTQKGENR